MSKVDLYPHNQTAYLKIKQAIENGDTKMAIAHATGTGKSYISARLFEDYNDDQKLVLVPTNFLYQNHKGLFDKYSIQNTNVMTYQSLIKKDSEEIDNMNYKVVVLDEYHHSTAQKWGESVRELIKSHPETIFLGTSATPVRTDGVNTIDEMFDSNCVSELPVSKAIALGILPMPRYVAVDYAYDKRFDELAKKVDKSSCTKEEKEEYHKQIKEMRLHVDQSYGMPIILNKYIENESGKYIVFCRNKKHLEEIKDTVIGWFKQAGFRNVNSYVVHSQNEEKDKEFKEFCNDDSGSLKLLFCINMLSEGLHLKGISGVVLLRTTSSYIVFQQQIGRALDANNNGTPLIIDAVNNYSYVQDGIDFFKEIEYEIKQCNIEMTDSSHLIDINLFLIIDQIQNVEKVFLSIENSLNYKYFANWTIEEDDILVRHYNSNTLKKIVHLLPNKTLDQCRYRVRILGLKKKTETAIWTTDEDDILRTYYFQNGINKCIEMLSNKSINQVNARLRYLNMYKREFWKKEQIEFLKENYSNMGGDRCSKILNKSKKSVIAYANKLGLVRKKTWSEEEDEILIEKYSTMGTKVIDYLPERSKAAIIKRAEELGIKANLRQIGRSKYPYVSWNNRDAKWFVRMRINGKDTYFGSFHNKEDAVKLAQEKANEYGKYWPED